MAAHATPHIPAPIPGHPTVLLGGSDPALGGTDIPHVTFPTPLPLHQVWTMLETISKKPPLQPPPRPGLVPRMVGTKVSPGDTMPALGMLCTGTGWKQRWLGRRPVASAVPEALTRSSPWEGEKPCCWHHSASPGASRLVQAEEVMDH